MKDLSSRVPGQPLSGMISAAGVNAAGAPAREGTAPGSESVVTLAGTDNVLDVAGGPLRQPTVLIGEGGAVDSAPPRSEPWVRAGHAEGGWTQV